MPGPRRVTIKAVDEPKIMPTNTDSVSNDAEVTLIAPFNVVVELEGTSALLFHRWSVEGVEAKAKAAKGSAAKKTDDVESYIWRNEAGEICIPGEYLRMSIIQAARYLQDPRSPRKSAMDLFKASIVCLNELATLGKTKWDYEDRRRVQVMRSGITRTRPAMHAGWKATFELQVLAPEYITQAMLRSVISNAGRLVGVGDFRPTFGRFDITSWKTEG